MTRFDRLLLVLWIVVTVAIAVLAVSAPVASAGRVSSTTIERSYQVSEHYWNARGVDPCDGTVIQRKASRFKRAELGGDPGVLAVAFVGPFPDADPYCKVILNAGTRWRIEAADGFGANARELVCTVVTHERGHNAGFDDDPRPWPIMNGWLVFIPDECRRAF